jgi:hypothetical protein
MQQTTIKRQISKHKNKAAGNTKTRKNIETQYKDSVSGSARRLEVNVDAAAATQTLCIYPGCAFSRGANAMSLRLSRGKRQGAAFTLKRHVLR